MAKEKRLTRKDPKRVVEVKALVDHPTGLVKGKLYNVGVSTADILVKRKLVEIVK